MSRKLASIQRVAEVAPIPEADAIEKVRVNGWWVVAKKGEFKVGDFCVYFEVDSVLPVDEKYEFLRKSCYVKKDWVEGFRLRTVKLRGQLSQGLVVPVPEFDGMKYLLPAGEGMAHAGNMVGVKVGDDVTELLGVVKWDPPVPAELNGLAVGNFPSFIPKTDQERLQNIYHAARAEHAEEPFEVTLKLDGTSCTVYWNNGKLGVCSRNLELLIAPETANNTMVQVAEKLRPALHGYTRNIAVQGELMGPGIQGNREKLQAPVFFVFDIVDLDTGHKLIPAERHAVCGALGISVGHLAFKDSGLCLEHVPVVSRWLRAFAEHKTMEAFLAASDIPSLQASVAEGLVYKSMLNGNISFKVINNKFLLQEK